MIRQSKIVLIVLIITISAVCLPVAANADSAETQRPDNAQDALGILSAMSLSPVDMPADFALSESGVNDFSDIAHPFNQSLVKAMSNCSSDVQAITINSVNAGCTLITEYTLGYGLSGHVPTTQTFIGNYLYKFATPDDAKSVALAVVDSWEYDFPEASLLSEFNLDKDVYARAMALVSEQNESIYWHISSRGNMVTLLLVHGVDRVQAMELFSSSVEKLSDKTSQTVTLQKMYLPFLVGGENQTQASEVNGMWQTAYAVGVAFRTWYPHYGAKFSGRNGRFQYYSGPTGTPSGFSGWTWYNDYSRNQLLLDSTWYWSTYGSGNPSHYHAYLDCPC